MPYKLIAKELLEKAKKMINETDWTFYSNNQDIKLETKMYPNCPVPCFRANGFVNAETHKVFNVANENNSEVDADILEFKLEKYDDDTNIVKQVNKLPWPLWSRKALTALTKIVEDNGNCWIIGHSTPDSKDETDKYVTVNVHMSVFGFIPENYGTRVWRITHIDPAGYIPTYVINSNAEKFSHAILEMKNYPYS